MLEILKNTFKTTLVQKFSGIKVYNTLARPIILYGKEILTLIKKIKGARGGVVVNAVCYKPAGRGFDSRCCHWNFSVT
jgi:hypothetical protein